MRALKSFGGGQDVASPRKSPFQLLRTVWAGARTQSLTKKEAEKMDWVHGIGPTSC